MERERSLLESLIFLYPVIEVNGKSQQLNSGRMISVPGPSGMILWVTPPKKEPRSAEVFAEGQVNTEWVIEGSYNTGYVCYQLQKQGL